MFRANDIFYALRTLRRTPGFTATILLSLALGIGSNAAIFSVVNALFLHPAGIDRPEQVVAPRVSYKKLHLDRIDLSLPDFLNVRNSTNIFSAAAAFNVGSLNYTGAYSPQRLKGANVTWQWFTVFGAKPMMGRAFRAEEDQPGSRNAVVLSFDLWKRMFGSQNSAIGQTIELDRKPFRIVGVMPANFRWPSQADLWLPLGLPQAEYAESHRFDEFYTVVARLRPGIDFARCGRFMNMLTGRTKTGNKDVALYANASEWSMGVERFAELTSGDLTTPLLILSASVGLVLLIACSNIAGLMLVRASSRSRELAIRRALGASTANLLSQSFTESALLATGGTLLGLFSISVLLKGLLALVPARITVGLVIEPDIYVVLAAVLTGVLAALLFGILPAWQATRLASRYEDLKEGGRSDTEGAHRQRIRSALVVGQVALALVLLVAAGLLLKSLERLRSAHLGFDESHLISAAVELPDTTYRENGQQTTFFRSVLADLKSRPGGISVAAAEPVPFNGDHWTGSFQIEGMPESPGDPGPHGYRGFISPRYFDTLRIPFVSGRDFTEGDRAGTQPVTIIDENLARRYWPHSNPIGLRLRNGDNSKWATIVGVVKHVRAYNFDAHDTRGIYYMPVYQQPISTMNFVIRTAGDPQWAGPLIAQGVHKQDSAQSVFDTATLRQRIDNTLGPQQFAVELLGIFAAVAILLSAIGLYGVISFSAGRRTREFGIRSALGASRAQILGMIASQGLRLTLAGLTLGCAVAIFTVRVISQSFEYASLDWFTIVLPMLLLGFVSLIAALVPAWRATRVDPLFALRNE